MVTVTGDLGHDLRLTLRAQLEADEIFERRCRREIANGIAPEINTARLAAIEEHERGLWDALANAQQL